MTQLAKTLPSKSQEICQIDSWQDVKDLPFMHWSSPVGADVLEAVDLPVDVSEQHQLFAKDLHAHRLVLDLLRDACTV